MSSKKYGGQFLKGLTTLRVAPEVTIRAIEDYLQSLDCPRALTVSLLFRNGEHEQLAKLGFDPLHYSNMVDLRDAYSATQFLSKYKGLSLPYDLDQVAMEKFESFELLCKRTNARFRNLACDPFYGGRTVRLHSAIVRKIDKILGEFSIEEFFSMPDWGPGASTTISRRDASSVNKFQCETGITRDLYSLLPNDLIKEVYPLWWNHLASVGKYPQFEVGNRVVTVPKDATANRVIAIEPGINIWFQKSIGRMIGRRLQRCGIDLRYQSINQEMAKQGSLSGLLSTIDLSSASDSISAKVVEELFSLEHSSRWLSVMEACRSHFGFQNASSRKWEKFSSMGNGFTFQLESLIFYAVALCCVEYLHLPSKEVSVYGDDIIIPTRCFDTFSELMTFYGFRINPKKSHTSSSFRESCGSHWYSGIDVKPVYLKDKLTSVPAVFRLANAFRRQAHRRNNNFGCDSRLRSVFEHLVRSVPFALRLRIPATLGDGGFISNFDEATPSYIRDKLSRSNVTRVIAGIWTKSLDTRKTLNHTDWQGFLVPNIVAVSKTYQDEREGYLLSSLWQMPVHDPEDRWDQEGRNILEAIERTWPISVTVGRNSVPRKTEVKLKCSMSIVPRWYDLGPWW